MFDHKNRAWLRQGCECQQTQRQQKDKPDVGHMAVRMIQDLEMDFEGFWKPRSWRERRKSSNQAHFAVERSHTLQSYGPGESQS